MIALLSCANCCFNALQFDTIGTAFGYCTEHRSVLRDSSELTCGRQFRKDLSLASAQEEHAIHKNEYPSSRIVFVRNTKAPDSTSVSQSEQDLVVLRQDPVAQVVSEYGQLNSKIESLAQLRMLPGARAEVAQLALGRTYVRRCKERRGSWTSGIHLFWWTKLRLTHEPEIKPDDIRLELELPLARQVELAKWAVLMFRLTFLSDVGSHASTAGHVRRLANLSEQAALATGSLSFSKLLKWVKREGVKRVEHALPQEEYIRLSKQLHHGD
jgi:hypothetical protein